MEFNHGLENAEFTPEEEKQFCAAMEGFLCNFFSKMISNGLEITKDYMATQAQEDCPMVLDTSVADNIWDIAAERAIKQVLDPGCESNQESSLLPTPPKP